MPLDARSGDSSTKVLIRIVPPIEPGELQAVYELLLERVPGDDA